jgi:hypothetical protein
MSMIKSVCYQDERNPKFKILISTFENLVEETVFFFKKQRYIKLLFKKIKQSFQYQDLYVKNEDFIYTEFWCILSAHLFFLVQKIAQKKKEFTVLFLILRIKLVSLANNFEFSPSNRKEYRNTSRGPPVMKKPLK